MIGTLKFDWNWPADSEEDFYNFSVYFHSYSITSPWKGGVDLHMNNSESLLPKDHLCHFWLQLAQRFWRRSRKCKSLTDDGQWAIRKVHLSFQLRWAKKPVSALLYRLLNQSQNCIPLYPYGDLILGHHFLRTKLHQFLLCYRPEACVSQSEHVLFSNLNFYLPEP
jgi:hypothetical protein